MLATLMLAAATVGTITISALVVQLVVSTLVPLVVGIVTKVNAPSSVKALTMIVVNAASALVVTSTQADGTAVISSTALLFAILGVVQSAATYLGVWKPLGVAQAVQSKTANFGIGGA